MPKAGEPARHSGHIVPERPVAEPQVLIDQCLAVGRAPGVEADEAGKRDHVPAKLRHPRTTMQACTLPQRKKMAGMDGVGPCRPQGTGKSIWGHEGVRAGEAPPPDATMTANWGANRARARVNRGFGFRRNSGFRAACSRLRSGTGRDRRPADGRHRCWARRFPRPPRRRPRGRPRADRPPPSSRARRARW